jgi:hypothetical protein
VPVQESADALQSLRINSAAEIVASLDKIATDLEAVEDEKTSSAMREAGEKVLKILSRIADQLATVKGSRIIVAGIISFVLGGAGYSAFTIYGVTLAFWQGPEVFTKAIEAIAKRKKQACPLKTYSAQRLASFLPTSTPLCARTHTNNPSVVGSRFTSIARKIEMRAYSPTSWTWNTTGAATGGSRYSTPSLTSTWT